MAFKENMGFYGVFMMTKTCGFCYQNEPLRLRTSLRLPGLPLLAGGSAALGAAEYVEPWAVVAFLNDLFTWVLGVLNVVF